MSVLRSFRRQNLLVEFASLKYTCPGGIYLCLTPGDLAVWSGVLFIRKGPYASAILRFQIEFPLSYPDSPPVITFHADVFHPLLVPLTTRTFKSVPFESDASSASDGERLPPGGFSLRHGFPHWFIKTRTVGSGAVSPNAPGSSSGSGPEENGTPGSSASSKISEGTNKDDDSSKVKSALHQGSQAVSIAGRYSQRDVSVAELLQYIRSTFDDANVLDSVPIEAAGNPSAWHAWRAYRGHSSAQRRTSLTRRPDEWNWEGVWEERATTCIEASISDAALYGSTGQGDNLIHFEKSDEDMLERARQHLKESAKPGSSI